MADTTHSTSLALEELFCLEGCRDYAQYHTMRKNFEDKCCPFCTVDTTINTTVYQNEHWMVWENPFPHEALAVQLVIASKTHVRFLEELRLKAWVEMYHVIQWIEGIEGKYSDQCKGGNLHIRFGDMQYNAGTVPHLHWNYWIPSGTGEIRIPVVKDPMDRAQNQVRAAEFAKRYDASKTP